MGVMEGKFHELKSITTKKESFRAFQAKQNLLSHQKEWKDNDIRRSKVDIIDGTPVIHVSRRARTNASNIAKEENMGIRRGYRYQVPRVEDREATRWEVTVSGHRG